MQDNTRGNRCVRPAAWRSCQTGHPAIRYRVGLETASAKRVGSLTIIISAWLFLQWNRLIARRFPDGSRHANRKSAKFRRNRIAPRRQERRGGASHGGGGYGGRTSRDA